MYLLVTFGGHKSYGNGDINSHINFYINFWEKSELTASVRLRDFQNQEYRFTFHTAGKKTRKRTQTIAKVLCVSNKSNKAFKLKDVTWIRSSKTVRVTLKIENTACKFSKKLCVTEIPIGMQNKNILIIIKSKVTINWVERTCKEIFKDGRVTRNRRYICQWGYI